MKAFLVFLLILLLTGCTTWHANTNLVQHNHEQRDIYIDFPNSSQCNFGNGWKNWNANAWNAVLLAGKKFNLRAIKQKSLASYHITISNCKYLSGKFSNTKAIASAITVGVIPLSGSHSVSLNLTLNSDESIADGEVFSGAGKVYEVSTTSGANYALTPLPEVEAFNAALQEAAYYAFSEMFEQYAFD